MNVPVCGITSASLGASPQQQDRGGDVRPHDCSVPGPFYEDLSRSSQESPEATPVHLFSLSPVCGQLPSDRASHTCQRVFAPSLNSIPQFRLWASHRRGGNPHPPTQSLVALDGRVFPTINSNACGKRSMMASSDSTAPAGLPGRFKIRLVPWTPHAPRLSTANQVFSIPSARMSSARPSISRSHTARVASGVT